VAVPEYFLYGDRSLSFYHARSRNKCSNLNADHCKNHLRDNSFCSYCTSRIEDAEHYFFKCPKYNEASVQLFHSTRSFHPLSVNILCLENNLFLMRISHLFLIRDKYLFNHRVDLNLNIFILSI
jgi:methionyl-tRNA synthetase